MNGEKLDKIKKHDTHKTGNIKFQEFVWARMQLLPKNLKYTRFIKRKQIAV